MRVVVEVCRCSEPWCMQCGRVVDRPAEPRPLDRLHRLTHDGYVLRFRDALGDHQYGHAPRRVARWDIIGEWTAPGPMRLVRPEALGRLEYQTVDTLPAR